MTWLPLPPVPLFWAPDCQPDVRAHVSQRHLIPGTFKSGLLVLLPCPPTPHTVSLTLCQSPPAQKTAHRLPSCLRQKPRRPSRFLPYLCPPSNPSATPVTSSSKTHLPYLFHVHSPSPRPSSAGPTTVASVLMFLLLLLFSSLSKWLAGAPVLFTGIRHFTALQFTALHR